MGTFFFDNPPVPEEMQEALDAATQPSAGSAKPTPPETDADRLWRAVVEASRGNG